MSHDFKSKEWDLTKSEKIEQKIRDYTVGLHHKCASGTGWILDYEWPENGEYPKKWFFATNAHVFDKFDFSKSEYKQDHPDKCVGYNTGSFFQMAIWKENKEKQIKKVDVKSTKLFYVARNHLGKADIPEKFDSRNVNVFKARNLSSTGENVSSETNNNKRNYFHDFIVLEVEFHDQYDAKDATDDFHNKYGDGIEKPINLFHDGITKDEENFFKEETYTTSYYVGGFPSQWEKQMSFNRNLEKYKGLSASTLSQETYNYGLKRMNDGLNALRGLGDNSSFEIQWGKGSSDNQNLTGFIYLIDRINIGAVGSGSMVVDENENFLGLYSFGDRNDGEVGGVQPIRSHSLEISKGKKSPKFDLIRGAEGQTSSYRSQLDKYYEGKRTFLRVKQPEQFNKSF